MFILMLFLIFLAVAGIVTTIRSVHLDGYGQKIPRTANEYDALIRWR